MRKPFMNQADWAKNVLYWEWRVPFSPDPSNKISMTKIYMAEGNMPSRGSLEQLCYISTEKKKKKSPVVLEVSDVVIVWLFDVIVIVGLTFAN